MNDDQSVPEVREEHVHRYLDPDLVSFLDVEARDDALEAMIEVVDATGRLEDKEAFLKAIMGREAIVSTGIGMGVAIPHAKLPGYEDFFIAIGISRHGLDWDSVDETPVRLIFMIGGPDDRQTDYLQILSRLTQALKDDTTRKKLINLTAPEEIITLFEGY
jgi:PTS system nitrogen regulatory IIA component